MASKALARKKPAGKHRSQQPEFLRAMDRRYPGVVDKIRQVIEKSEKEFSGSELEDNFLWEHSLHVAYLAWRIARMEKTDSALAGLAALFYEASYFQAGLYHQMETGGKEVTGEIALNLLKTMEIKTRQQRRLKEILINLCQGSRKSHHLTDIVDDADFLAKFDLENRASFLNKTTSGGQKWHQTIMNQLSREMTYASALAQMMRTKTGLELAREKSEESLNFYKNLLQELKDIHGLSYKIKKRQVKIPSGLQKKQPVRLDVFLVMATRCDRCEGKWAVRQSLEQGIKCRQAVFSLTCSNCGNTYHINFCLPGLKEVQPK